MRCLTVYLCLEMCPGFAPKEIYILWLYMFVELMRAVRERQVERCNVFILFVVVSTFKNVFVIQRNILSIS